MVRPKSAMETFALLLAPMAPHIAEELWQILGHAETLAYEPWPIVRSGVAQGRRDEVPVQINGKLKGRILVPADADGGAGKDRSRATRRSRP